MLQVLKRSAPSAVFFLFKEPETASCYPKNCERAVTLTSCTPYIDRMFIIFGELASVVVLENQSSTYSCCCTRTNHSSQHSFNRRALYGITFESRGIETALSRIFLHNTINLISRHCPMSAKAQLPDRTKRPEAGRFIKSFSRSLEKRLIRLQCVFTRDASCLNNREERQDGRVLQPFLTSP